MSMFDPLADLLTYGPRSLGSDKFNFLFCGFGWIYLLSTFLKGDIIYL